MSTRPKAGPTEQELRQKVIDLEAALAAHNARVGSGAPAAPTARLEAEEMAHAARDHASRAHQLLADADTAMQGYLAAGIVPNAAHRGMVELAAAHAAAAAALAAVSALKPVL